MKSLRSRTDSLSNLITRLRRSVRRGNVRPGEPALAVLTYHRVGDRTRAEFDPWVYTSNSDQLEDHISYIRQHCRLVGLDEALAIAAGHERISSAAVLMTFDDAYVDNYETALPVLSSHNVEAVFFVVSAFAEGQTVPWWDQIAWLIKNTPVSRIHLADCGAKAEFDLERTNRDEVAMKVTDLYKSESNTRPQQFLSELERACRLTAPKTSPRLFCSWDQLRKMKSAGMVIGAHTCTHPVLAKLTTEQQISELKASKQMLEKELNAEVDVMAYPVGDRSDFTAQTEHLAKECGYRAAFSCYGGMNRPGDSRLFDLKRIMVYWNARPEWLLDGRGGV